MICATSWNEIKNFENDGTDLFLYTFSVLSMAFNVQLKFQETITAFLAKGPLCVVHINYH